MSDDLKPGDRVEWSSSGGKSVGRVAKKLTKPIDIKGHHVAASPENPELLVESDTGGKAAHKPAALKKLGSAATDTKGKASATKSSPKTGSAAKRSAATKKTSPAKKSAGTRRTSAAKKTS